MKSVNPYLNFPGNTEEAFDFYKSVFGGGFAMVVRFRDLAASNTSNLTTLVSTKISHGAGSRS